MDYSGGWKSRQNPRYWRTFTDRRDVTVEHVLVSSTEDAERWRCRGSPTVLIDGHDPLAHADAPIGFGCRVNPTPAGPIGTPSLQQLLDVLTDR